MASSLSRILDKFIHWVKVDLVEIVRAGTFLTSPTWTLFLLLVYIFWIVKTDESLLSDIDVHFLTTLDVFWTR